MAIGLSVLRRRIAFVDWICGTLMRARSAEQEKADIKFVTSVSATVQLRDALAEAHLQERETSWEIVPAAILTYP